MAITSLDRLDLSKTYSYADYLQWQFEEMVELIQGKTIRMSPAPNRKHQEISTNLFRFMVQRFDNKSACKLYTAPFDVRLYDLRQSKKADQEIFTVIQPDLCIICDPEKLDEQGCNGAPDLIVEILAKGNARKEVRTKFNLCEAAGVREYWIVFPYESVLQQFVLDDIGKYQLKDSFAEDEIFRGHIFPELEISLEEVFQK